mgnify:CR=1 FL=1
MREDRLLKRIKAWQDAPQRREKDDPRKILESVLNHLQRILNTRQGNVPIGPEYGVPDFTDLVQVYPEGVRDFEKSIRQTIQRYEPRLTGVRVRFIPPGDDVLSLRFQIKGKLDTDDRRDSVSFESTVGSDGRIRVKR